MFLHTLARLPPIERGLKTMTNTERIQDLKNRLGYMVRNHDDLYPSCTNNQENFLKYRALVIEIDMLKGRIKALEGER